MTTTVVVDKNSTIVSTVKEPTVIYTGIIGPPGPGSIAEMPDVDASQLNSGSLLVYNAQTQKWTSTTLLNQQVVDSGQY